MEKKHFSTKTIADCGIFTALAVLLLLIGIYIPIFGTLVMFLWSVPVMIVILRNGVPAGVAVSVITAILAMVFAGVLNGLFAALSLAGFGLVYGICFKKQYSPGKTLIFGILAAAAVTLASITFGGILGSLNFSSLLSSFEAHMREAYAAYADAGLLDAMVPAGMTAQTYVEQIIALMKQLLPAIFVIVAMMMAAGNYFFAVLILRRLRFDIRPLPKFRDWHLPWWVMWGLVIALLSLVVGNFTHNELLLTLAKNIAISYCPILIIAGIAFTRYIMVRVGMGVIFQGVIWLAALMFPSVAVMFFILIGAVDTILDYRNNIGKQKSKKDGGTEK
ncbi:MAG TPA: DUF2232 domain-containing protein [Clostridiales bacterium]|nr:DUF2232 domain-containing protein [Clostridiales bacterium]